MSRPTLRLPRLGCSIMKLAPPAARGTSPEVTRPRWGSPVAGCSTLMTSAPHSARTAPAAGTNVHDATSTTRTPSMTPPMRGQLLFAFSRIASASDDAGFVALPVAVAEQALVELAGRQTREFVFEV